MDSEREENIEERYRHRHIDIDIEREEEKKRRKKKERRFYVPASFENTFDMLQSILKREGSNFSAWVRDNAESYVRLHEPGNPQQRLDTIMQLGKSYHAPSKICGFKDCLRNAVAIGLFIPKGETYGLCKVHLKEAKENKKLWKLVKS